MKISIISNPKIDTKSKSKSVNGMFNFLKSAPKRIALPDVPTPSSFGLTRNFYPDSINIADCVLKILNRKISTKELTKSKEYHDTPGSWFKGPF